MDRSTFSVLFYVNKGKVKNGTAPVMGRITINGTQSQFSCKRSIPLTMWDVKGNCAKGRSREALDLNRDLDNIKAQIIKHYQHLSEKDLARIKAEAKTEELKNSATKTAASVLNGVNSLLGGNKVNRLDKENAQLHREVDDLNDQIESLHTDMQKIKDSHARELNRTNEQHQQEVSNLKRILDKAYRWSQVSSVSSIWSVNVCNMVSAKNRPANCYTGRPSTIAGGYTPMSTGAMHLPIT